jgi:hypothetical protein
MSQRSHDQMELEGSSSPTWSNFNRFSASREPSASGPPRPALHLPRPENMPRRYPGDGLDYRRPAQSANIIDLTHEEAGPSAAPSDQQQNRPRPNRPPRFERDILDVIDVDAEDTQEATNLGPTSPEIEFVGSRRIEPARGMEGRSPGGSSLDEDGVEFVRANPLPEHVRRQNGIEFVNRMLQTAAGHHLQAQIDRQYRITSTAERQRQATIDNVTARMHNGHRAPQPPPRRRTNIHVGFIRPNNNYGMVGFDMGFGSSEPDEPVQRPPTYTAPPPAPEGFTRSPQENDALICPNCGEELCTGDSDLKKQVWMVKGCGHVRSLSLKL